MHRSWAIIYLIRTAGIGYARNFADSAVLIRYSAKCGNRTKEAMKFPRYPASPASLSVTAAYCDEHRGYSGGANERGYDGKWRKARARFLRRNPLCAECRKEGRLTPAMVVDHVIPHRGNQALFWDEGNWQPLCKVCHDKKTGGGL